MSLFVISTVPRTDACILLSMRYVPWPLNWVVVTSWNLLRRWWGLQGQQGSSCLRQSCSGWHLFELLSFAISSTNLVYNKQNRMEVLPTNITNIHMNIRHRKNLSHQQFTFIDLLLCLLTFGKYERFFHNFQGTVYLKIKSVFSWKMAIYFSVFRLLYRNQSNTICNQSPLLYEADPGCILNSL